MALRLPATAILTVALLAAASTDAAWAVDCEQLRQQLVGQYGVVLRYEGGVTVVSRRCDQIRAQYKVDTAALDQCSASLRDLDASYQQANSTYIQLFVSFNAQCTTTATYGPLGAPPYAKDGQTELPNGAPGYAMDDGSKSPYSPYFGQPSTAQPNQPPPNPYATTFSDQDAQQWQQFATPDGTQAYNAVGQAVKTGISAMWGRGGFFSGRGGGSRSTARGGGSGMQEPCK